MLTDEHSVNGHHPQIGDTSNEVERLRAELAVTHDEIERLQEVRRRLEDEQQTALRDAVMRTRQYIEQMEREHEAELRRVDEETETTLRRLGARRGQGRGAS